MSKGHGKWERAILQALEQVPAFYLTDLLPEPYLSHAEIIRLKDEGKTHREVVEREVVLTPAVHPNRSNFGAVVTAGCC